MQIDEVDLDRELAPRSLAAFIEMAWPVIDAEPYQHNWHMDALSDHLMACHRGDINRLLINVPPGTSKSSAASVFFPAWLWGPAVAPHSRFIGASHESTLATRDNLRARRLIESDWFRARWPIQMVTDQNEKTNFENDVGGFRQASAVASMTGKRGHFVVWDDPQNPEATESDTSRDKAVRIFKETLTSRLVNPQKSSIIIIMQRLHAQDVSGHILARDLGYTHLMLPMEFEPDRRCYTRVRPTWRKVRPVMARYDRKDQMWRLSGAPVPPERAAEIEQIKPQMVYSQDPRAKAGDLLFPERFTTDVVERDKAVMGEYATAGQLQQRPSPRGGGLFKTGLIEIIPACPPLKRAVRAWDLAASKTSGSAFTAGCGLGETEKGEFVIFDMVRGRWSDEEVEANVRATASQDAHRFPGIVGSIPQDPGAGGKAWARSIIKAAAGFDYHMSPESGAKETRARPLAAQANIGNLKLVAGEWNAAFLDEAGAFPNSAYKDQIDAASRAFGVLLTASEFRWYVGG